jgi:hypothetical protein
MPRIDLTDDDEQADEAHMTRAVILYALVAWALLAFIVGFVLQYRAPMEL